MNRIVYTTRSIRHILVILEIYIIEALHTQWNTNKHSLSPVALYRLQVHFDPIQPGLGLVILFILLVYRWHE